MCLNPWLWQVRAYNQSAATLNLLRGFSYGGYGGLTRVSQVEQWQGVHELWCQHPSAWARGGGEFQKAAQIGGIREPGMSQALGFWALGCLHARVGTGGDKLFINRGHVKCSAAGSGLCSLHGPMAMPRPRMAPWHGVACAHWAHGCERTH